LPLKGYERMRRWPATAKRCAASTGRRFPASIWWQPSPTTTRVVVAEAETVGKGHEVAGAPAVLAALPARLLAGRVVTGEALLATRALGRQLVRKGGPSSSS
jgi:hypothetical protein